MVKEYSNGDITVLWEPEKCIHSGICLRGLPKVFNLKQRPWINTDAATSKDIVSLVRECPSKALSIKGVKFKEKVNEEVHVELIPGGPLIIKGGAIVHYRKNETTIEETVSFCRCKGSKNFPYCDGSHAQPKDK